MTFETFVIQLLLYVAFAIIRLLARLWAAAKRAAEGATK